MAAWRGLNRSRRWAAGAFMAIALALAVSWLSSFLSSPAAPAPVDDFGPVLSLPSARWYKTAHFYTIASFRNQEKKQVPYMACQHLEDGEAVHLAVLGPKVATVVSDTATEHAIDEHRARGLLRCVLEDKARLFVDHHASRHQQHIDRPRPWETASVSRSEWLEDAPVRHMFLTGTGERLYRVVGIRAGHQTPQPLVVAEKELLAAAHNWYHEMILEAQTEGLREDRPCLCDAHLGIYGSGLFFTYDSAQREWSLRLDVGISRTFTKLGETQPIKYWHKFDFPFKVDKQLRLDTGLESDPNYHGHVEITFIDPANVAAEVGKRQMLQGLDAPNDDLGLLGIVDLTTLGLQPAKARIVETDCDCTHYCLALNAAIARRVAPVFAGSSADTIITLGGSGGRD